MSVPVYFFEWLLSWIHTPFYILQRFKIDAGFELNGSPVVFSLLDVIVVLALASVFISIFVRSIYVGVERGRRE